MGDDWRPPSYLRKRCRKLWSTSEPALLAMPVVLLAREGQALM